MALQGSEGLAGLLERPAGALGFTSSAEEAMAEGALLVGGVVLIRGWVCHSGWGSSSQCCSAGLQEGKGHCMPVVHVALYVSNRQCIVGCCSCFA